METSNIHPINNKEKLVALVVKKKIRLISFYITINKTSYAKPTNKANLIISAICDVDIHTAKDYRIKANNNINTQKNTLIESPALFNI